MPVLADTDLIHVHSQYRNQTPSGGGRSSEDAVVSGASGVVIPNLDAAQLAAGGIVYRKTHWTNRPASGNPEGASPVRYLFAPPGGDMSVYFADSTQEQVFSQFVPSTADWYGTGLLEGAVSAAATEIEVAVADTAMVVFRDGEQIRISAQTSPTDAVSNWEFSTISGTPVIAGGTVTITLAAGLANGYSAGAKVSSVLAGVDPVVAEVESATFVSPTGGTFDSSQVTLYAAGARRQVFTFEFTSATGGILSGDVWGSVGNGGTFTTTADKTISHPSLEIPALVIPAAAWGGTRASGDVLTLTVAESSVSQWIKAEWPPNSAAVSAQPILCFEVLSP